MAAKKKLSKKAAGKKKVAKKKTDVAKAAKGPKVNAEWARLLVENEKAPKSAKKTDDQLVAEMERLFPEKAGRSTLTRVSMVRAIYNKGTNMFLKFGPAAVKSHRYDENGEVCKGRKIKIAKKTASKKAAKKKTAKKGGKSKAKGAKKS